MIALYFALNEGAGNQFAMCSRLSYSRLFFHEEVQQARVWMKSIKIPCESGEDVQTDRIFCLIMKLIYRSRLKA